MFYEVLFAESGLYYINYYENGYECKPTRLKLSTYEFEKWKVGKVER